MNAPPPRSRSAGSRTSATRGRAGDFGTFDDDSGAGGFAAGAVPGLVLITGPERVLAERILDAALAALRAGDPQIEVVRLDAAGYQAGSIARHASPSLFGTATALIVRDLDEAGDDLAADLTRYLAAPPGHVTLLAWHKGGNRGKRLLDALKKAGARVLSAPAITTERDKAAFVEGEFRRAGRRIDPEAAHALIEAAGKDIPELASACRQLIGDTTGTVGTAEVATYYGGRITASGFRVAAAALAGDVTEALTLTRHAIAVGTDPVPIVAALAVQVRQLVTVMGAPQGPAASLAGSLGMAPWQIDRARRALRGWSEQGLADAVTAIAAADADVKGGSRDPVYAVERCVIEVTRARRRGGRGGEPTDRARASIPARTARSARRW